ncbi:MAG: PQQ-binding-like beta-propeller repeat protein [Planctomycetota bacterium]|nr:PQQ-binding-like beta-propeller repeat protein [Planctomycetota bacterium]
MRIWLTLGLLLLSGISSAFAGNWPNWRGPGQNGVAPGKGFPTSWSKTENVAWTAELPGKGASTPIVWNDRVILTCGVEGDNVVLCFNSSGKLQWSQKVGKEREGKHAKATGSNPSAATDGKLVYVYFKSGDLAALDLDGKVVWHCNLQQKFGEDTLWWDLGTSPILTRDHVIVAVMQTGPSYIAAFDKQTGKDAWKVDRNLNAPSEAAQSYSTPIVVTEGDRQTLIVLGADHVTAHNAADGAELWRVGGLNPSGNGFFRSISSPVVSGDVVVAPYARGSTLTAIKLGGSGDVTKKNIVWSKDKLGADVPTPATLDGKVYLCTDKGEVHCLDAVSGKSLWSGAVEKNRGAFSASPVIADGKIFITREDGKTFVLDQGSEFKTLATNELEGEFVVATPVFVDGKIYIRTRERLYCIGK